MEEKKVEEQEENEVINIKAINEGTLVLNTNLEGKKVGPCNLSITASKIWWNDARGKLIGVVDWNFVAGASISEEEKALIIHAAPLKQNDNTKHERKEYTFYFQNVEELKKWKANVDFIIKRTEFHGPENKKRKLIVFINPFSGLRLGPKMWKDVKPLFDAAQIETTVIETERKDHAHDFARDSLPVGEYDGIITVSGDGLMWEVINGIMLRPDWYKLIKTPIGIIPAGSGNAMGSYLRSLDYFTAAMNIIKGYHRPLDLWRVKQKDRLEWGFVVLAWCMVSDVAMEAENRRWMGSIRFDFGALLSIARFKRYPGRLSFLPIENFAKNRCSPHFGECPHCLPKISLENVKDEEIILQSKITHTDYANPPPNWKVIKDEFVWFTCGNTTHLKPDMVGFPFAHIGDGSLDLVFCRKGVQDIGRTELLKLFSKFENGEFVEHQAVEYYKAQAFVLEPLSKEGTFMLDGEPIAYETVTCENFQGLGNVFCKPPKLI